MPRWQSWAWLCGVNNTAEYFYLQISSRNLLRKSSIIWTKWDRIMTIQCSNYTPSGIRMMGYKNIWNGWEKNRLRPCCLELPAVHGHKVSLDVSRGPGSNLESLWSKQVFSFQECFDPTKSLKMSGKVWLLSIHWRLENITVIQLKFNFFASNLKWDKRVSSQIKYGNFKNMFIEWFFYMNTNNFTSSTNEHYSWPV